MQISLHMLAMYQMVAQCKEAIGDLLLSHRLQLLHGCPSILAQHPSGCPLPDHHQHSSSEDRPRWMDNHPGMQL